MEFIELFNLILHFDESLGKMIENYGYLVYFFLFLIIFAETGLVIFPFLPGDTLLFVSGAFCATGFMDISFLIIILILAAILGNSLNFYIGSLIGTKAYTKNYRWLDRTSLNKTNQFFIIHGGKTIILARWIPVIRTFAPFVAGISKMNYVKFQMFNISSAIFWVVILVISGYYFGNIPIIKNNLNNIIIVGILAAILPISFIALWRFITRSRKT
tara:strand:- start:884 stop:1528 length:645 start_codon:yes stop_codon:yes gene_type:complete